MTFHLSWRMLWTLPAASLALVCANCTHAETLREALSAKNVPLAKAKLANLDKGITSGAELDDSNQFVIAYYLDNKEGSLEPPLYLERYDKKRDVWDSTAVSADRSGEPAIDSVCFGSVLQVKAIGRRLLLDTHINPSAGCVLVVSADLKVETSFDGWVLGRLNDDKIVFHRSEVHFAPVHPAELAIYDLAKKHDWTIFPPKTATPVRKAREAQLAEFYKGKEDWCNKNDDPCKADEFDSDIAVPVVTNTAEGAVGVHVSYEQIQFVEGDVQKPSGPKDVLYICRHADEEAKVQCQEMLASEAKDRFGDVPLEKLLEPESLQKIFVEVPAKKP
jgi:hypothetical protein